MRRKGTAAALMALILSTAPAPAVDWDKVGEEALAYLQQYIKINTSNPPGDVIEAARFLRKILESNGIAVEWYEPLPGRKANLVARLGGSGAGKPVLLLHHMDVVPADPSRWQLDPFGGIIKDGYIWGRGAMDMKGLGIIHLMTMLTLKREKVPLSRQVIFMAVADEEIGGGLGAQYMVEHHYDKLDPEYVFDEGGFGSRDVLAKDRLVYGISVAEKRVQWLRLIAEGEAGHGSQPLEPNANNILVRALARAIGFNEPPQSNPVLEEMRRKLGSLAENKFTNAIQHNTVSLTTLRAGVGAPPKVNVIPSRSEATLDCRLLPGQPVAGFLDKLRSLIADDRIKIETIYSSVAPPGSPFDTALFKVIERVIARHDPDAVTVPMLIPYGTDSNLFRTKGAKSYGFTPVVVSLRDVSSMHSDEERMPVEGFKRGIRMFYDIISEFCGRR